MLHYFVIFTLYCNSLTIRLPHQRKAWSLSRIKNKSSENPCFVLSSLLEIISSTLKFQRHGTKVQFLNSSPYYPLTSLELYNHKVILCFKILITALKYVSSVTKDVFSVTKEVFSVTKEWCTTYPLVMKDFSYLQQQDLLRQDTQVHSLRISLLHFLSAN